MSLPPHPEENSIFPQQSLAGQTLPDLDPPPFYPISNEETESDEDETEESWENEDSSAFSLAGWKTALREDFESWLDALDDIPSELREEDEPDENPDLATVFGDLSSLALESRKSNRRTTEAFSQWNAVLTGFQDDLKRLRERERVLMENQPAPDPVPAPLAAFLVDFHDRLTRLTQVQMPNAKLGFFGDDTAWKTAWKNQHSALNITLSHLQSFLKEQGFRRILTLGQPLDPIQMAVVETRLAPDKLPHTVIEEIAPGWILGTRVLRPAQVIVAVTSPPSIR